MKRPLILIFLIVLFEQAVKFAVSLSFDVGECVYILGNWGFMGRILNTGNVLVAIAFSVGCVIIGIMILRKRRSVPLILFMSGVLTNLIDRVYYGGVIDYLAYEAFWFNAGDVLILVGLIGIVFSLWINFIHSSVEVLSRL